ncbi:hypothetical protein ACFL2D_00110 [Patescibacteria group bacterium]
MARPKGPKKERRTILLGESDADKLKTIQLGTTDYDQGSSYNEIIRRLLSREMHERRWARQGYRRIYVLEDGDDRITKQIPKLPKKVRKEPVGLRLQLLFTERVLAIYNMLKGGRPHVKKPDIDDSNLIDLVCDMLNGDLSKVQAESVLKMLAERYENAVAPKEEKSSGTDLIRRIIHNGYEERKLTVEEGYRRLWSRKRKGVIEEFGAFFI